MTIAPNHVVYLSGTHDAILLILGPSALPLVLPAGVLRLEARLTIPHRYKSALLLYYTQNLMRVKSYPPRVPPVFVEVVCHSAQAPNRHRAVIRLLPDNALPVIYG